MLALGFVLVLVLNALVLKLASDLLENTFVGGQLRLGAAGGAPGRSRERLPRGDLRDERRRHLHAARRPANRPPPGWRRPATDVPGIIYLEIDGLALPVLRRAMRDGNAPNMARWVARRHARADRVGDRPLLADGSEPGGDPARLERRHPGVPLGGQGDRHAHGVLGSRRLRAHRGRARHGHRPARRRRLEPRQPALGRGRGGHPHRQPHGGREEGEPRLSRVLRQRVQRHASARPVRMGGHPRVDCGAPGDPSRRAAAGSPRRHLPVPARRDVRDRPRPDRLRRPHGHDARPARRLCDVLELRRGRAPLGARARRHARGAAEARPAVRAHRPRAPLRAASLRDRRALRPRADAGSDVQAAERLRARRARRALARARNRREGRRRRRAALDGRARRRRGDRTTRQEEGQAREERRLGPGRSSCSARETSV